MKRDKEQELSEVERMREGENEREREPISRALSRILNEFNKFVIF